MNGNGKKHLPAKGRGSETRLLASYCREDRGKMCSSMRLCRFNETVKKEEKKRDVRWSSQRLILSPWLFTCGILDKEEPCSTGFFLFPHSVDPIRQKVWCFLFGINEKVVWLIRKTREVSLPWVAANTFPHGREYMNEEMKPCLWFCRGENTEKWGSNWVAMVTVLKRVELNPPLQDWATWWNQGGRAQLLLSLNDSALFLRPLDAGGRRTWSV